MSYNRILPHKLVKYDVFKVTVQGVSWIRGVRQVRLAENVLVVAASPPRHALFGADDDVGATAGRS